MSNKVPEGWAEASLAEICQLNPPKPSADFLPPDAKVTFAPMPSLDADSGALTAPEIRPFAKVRIGHPSFRDGDVIMAKITPCMENGKAAVLRGLKNGIGFGSTEFHVLRPTVAVLAEYVYYFIRQESFREAAAAEMTGSVGQKRVPASFLETTEIPVPPLAEQKRIINKIEALLARVNDARQRLHKMPAILKRFRQSVLAAACSGRITADWREHNEIRRLSDEWRRHLLDQRKKQLSSNGEKKYKQPVPPDSQYLEDLPDSWATLSLDELTTLITSGSRDWSKYYGSGTGTFIMAQNVRPGFLDMSFRQPVDPPIDDRDRKRSQVSIGDVLVTIVGANTGDVCHVDRLLPEHYVCQSVAMLRPISATFGPYLNLFLNCSKFGGGQFQSFIYGEGRPHLGFEHIRMTAIAFPPLNEQHEIVRRVNVLFKLADAIEKRVVAATARAEKLTQAILAKAFCGELVPTEAELARREGREYEPASALLERIKAERSKVSDGSPKPRKKRTPVRN
jgi:type I restriction enzyme S subunit